MMSRVHNFESLTTARGWCVREVRFGHMPQIAAILTSLPAIATPSGKLLAKRYSESFMDLGSQEVNS